MGQEIDNENGMQTNVNKIDTCELYMDVENKSEEKKQLIDDIF